MVCLHGRTIYIRQPLTWNWHILAIELRSANEAAVADFQFRNSLKKQFDKEVFQRKLVRWIVHTNQSFRVAEKDTFRDILDYLNPIISATNAHLSRQAIRRRVTDE